MVLYHNFITDKEAEDIKTLSQQGVSNKLTIMAPTSAKIALKYIPIGRNMTAQGVAERWRVLLWYRLWHYWSVRADYKRGPPVPAYKDHVCSSSNRSIPKTWLTRRTFLHEQGKQHTDHHSSTSFTTMSGMPVLCNANQRNVKREKKRSGAKRDLLKGPFVGRVAWTSDM